MEIYHTAGLGILSQFTENITMDRVKMIPNQKIMMLSGSETSSLNVGEVWHFFEGQLHYPLTVVDINDFSFKALNKFNVLIVPEGWYGSLSSPETHEEMKNWIEEKIEEKSNNEHWVPFADRAEITGVVVVPKDRKGWQPTKLPRPVYTTAAKAVPSKRIIDLTSTGQWSAEQERIKALSGRDDDLFDQTTLSDTGEEEKAVNQ